MIDRLLHMFGMKRNVPEKFECADEFTPTRAQVNLAREQEQIRDAIRIRALQANIDVLTVRHRDGYGHHDDH